MSIPTEARPLAEARQIAGAFMLELLPGCERIEIAGSIRRERPTINDIELVAIPRLQEVAPPPPAQGGLFGAPTAPAALRVNLLWERLEDLGPGAVQPIKPGVSELEPDPNWPKKREEGSRYFRLWLPRTRLKVDLFLADVETWGVIFAIRTGSADFSREMVTRWTRRSGGGHCEGGRLKWPSGAMQKTPEEVDVFEALGLVFTPPKFRGGLEDFVELSTAGKAAS